MIEAGADLIIGHHSHILRPIEFYRDGLILYSTVNFVFDWNEGWGPETMSLMRTRTFRPYQPALAQDDWFESAVFHVQLRNGRMPELIVDAIALDSNSQPIMPDADGARTILSKLEKMSQKLDPAIHIDSNGTIERRLQIS